MGPGVGPKKEAVCCGILLLNFSIAIASKGNFSTIKKKAAILDACSGSGLDYCVCF